VFEPLEDRIYWAETQSNGYQPSLARRAAHIGELMQRYLWREKTAIVLTPPLLPPPASSVICAAG